MIRILKPKSIKAKIVSIFFSLAVLIIALDIIIRDYYPDRYVFLIALVYITLISVVIIISVDRIISKPIKRISDHLEDAAKGKYQKPVMIGSDDEFDLIIKASNKMIKQVRENESLVNERVKNITLQLNKKISDLQRFREFTSDTEIYAEKMRKERDEAKKEIGKLRKELEKLKKKR